MTYATLLGGILILIYFVFPYLANRQKQEQYCHFIRGTAPSDATAKSRVRG